MSMGRLSFAHIYIVVIILFALLADIIASDSHRFAIAPYSAGKSDFENLYTSPFGEQVLANTQHQKTDMPLRHRHWLGTNKRGEDVLAGIIHGSRISLSVGFFSMFISVVIGLLLGMSAGYFGNEKLYASRIKIIFVLLALIPAWFYSFTLRIYILKDAIQNSTFLFLLQLFLSVMLFVVIIYIAARIAELFYFFSFLKKRVRLPLDSIITKCIEVFVSLPKLILVLTFAAIAKPSVVNMIFIFGLTTWTDIARLVRAETMHIKEQNYIEAAHELGIRTFSILIKHILPNLKTVLITAFIFGMAQVILSESALSFLGIGVPVDTVSWGTLLSSGKENIHAWWLIVFPGLALFFLIASLNKIAEGYSSKTSP
jgi:peptide/nickel transport system permease protein